MKTTPKPNGSETRFGTVFFLLWLFVLPTLFTSLNGLLPVPLSSGMLNFLFYLVSFLCAVFIFREFLLQSFRGLSQSWLRVLGYAVLGFLGNLVTGQLLLAVFSVLIPGFQNYNDQLVANALLDAPVLMGTGVVALVPVTEELLFRGLIFRSLWERSGIAAYLVSILSFAGLHLFGYVGSMPSAQLLLSLLQYLPAGFFLAFAYRRSGSIVSPMLMHALVNAFSLFLVFWR